MSSFSLNVSGDNQDFSVGSDGRLVLSRGGECARQRIKVRLWRDLGEWWLDTTQGINWYNNGLLGETTEIDLISATLRREILLDPEVAQIDVFEITRDTGADRGYTINSSVKLNVPEYNGQTTITMSL